VKVTVNFDSTRIEGSIAKAFDSYNQLLEAQFTKEISTKQFQWPVSYKTTRGSYNRKGTGRESVGSPRDIIDSGAFRQSQQRTRTASGYRYSWNVSYAAPILYGYRTRAANQMPPRNWIQPALVKFPVVPFLKRYLGQ
jgi:hypothetical protein